ncbi:Phosphate acetyltransferase [hydrothermal vent metagenome]|uniref:Phosphate acetyltransferase n=1 Tax=hydrothermal vent metagenome TaxID=652676 RepID=A0A3B0UCY7_9ZZZZ
MAMQFGTMKDLIDRAQDFDPIKVAVVDAAQGLVIETLAEAHGLGIVEPALIGDPEAIKNVAKAHDWPLRDGWIIAASDDVAAAAKAVRMVRDGAADAVVKGNIHTDILLRALLDTDQGLRLPGRRVSHVFVTDIPAYPKLLGITDAAINITPDLSAKAQIVQNAVELFHLLGVKTPKVAALSAVETVTPAIVSTLDAACLTLMARRGQIGDALVDGPLAFDNAISAAAAAEKGIVSEVAGDADIVLAPDLVSGNILAKNLEYLAGAVAAGVVMGLSAPVALSSRADDPAARLAALALVSLIFHHSDKAAPPRPAPPEPSLHCAPQPEHACGPPP